RLRMKKSNSCAQRDFTAVVAYVIACEIVELCERDRGNAHAPSFCRLQERLAEDLRSVVDRHAVKVFIERADEHNFPEALDGSACLMISSEPLGKRAMGILADVAWNAAHERDHGRCDGGLVAQRKRVKTKKRWCIMKWRREK